MLDLYLFKGVVQGSVSGHTLFNYMMDDIVGHIIPPVHISM